MRIAYLSADLGIPYHGGKAGALHMRQTVSALVKFGHEVCVCHRDKLVGRNGRDRRSGRSQI